MSGSSHIIEKWEVNRKIFLVDIEVQDKKCQRTCGEIIKTNKFVPPDMWYLITKKMFTILEKFAKNLGEIKEDEETLYRFPESTYIMKYTFKGECSRDMLNTIYHVPDRQMYKSCFHAMIYDEGPELYGKIEELQARVLTLQQQVEISQQNSFEYVSVKEASYSPNCHENTIYEYTPSYSASDNIEYKPAQAETYQPRRSTEYVPTPLNGDQNHNNNMYKPTKIEANSESTISEPYSPSYNNSPKRNASKIEYIPTSTQKSEQDDSSSPMSNITKRRRKFRSELMKTDSFPSLNSSFTTEEDNENVMKTPKKKVEPKKLSLSGTKNKKTKDKGKDSDQSMDLFGSDDDETVPVVLQSPGALEKATSREQLPRKSKQTLVLKYSQSPSPERSPAVKKRKREEKEREKKEERERQRKEREEKKAKDKEREKEKKAITEKYGTGGMDWLSKENFNIFTHPSTSSSASSSYNNRDGRDKGKENEKDKIKDDKKDEKKRVEKKKETKKENEKKKEEKIVMFSDRTKAEKEIEEIKAATEVLRKIQERLPKIPDHPPIQVINCTEMTDADIIATFPDHRSGLRRIFDECKDAREKEWHKNKDLCCFDECTDIFTEAQMLLMMNYLEKEFTSEKEVGKYTEFFACVLVYEWALAIFMKEFHFTRQDALDRIKLQEECNPVELSQIVPKNMRQKRHNSSEENDGKCSYKYPSKKDVESVNFSVKSGVSGDQMFAQKLAVLIWGEEELVKRSVKGKQPKYKINRRVGSNERTLVNKTELVRRRALSPLKLKFIRDQVYLRSLAEGCTKTQILERSKEEAITKYLNKKIQNLRKKEFKSANESLVEEKSFENYDYPEEYSFGQNCEGDTADYYCDQTEDFSITIIKNEIEIEENPNNNLLLPYTFREVAGEPFEQPTITEDISIKEDPLDFEYEI